jgi:hypothetical protein
MRDRGSRAKVYRRKGKMKSPGEAGAFCAPATHDPAGFAATLSLVPQALTARVLGPYFIQNSLRELGGVGLKKMLGCRPWPDRGLCAEPQTRHDAPPWRI